MLDEFPRLPATIALIRDRLVSSIAWFSFTWQSCFGQAPVVIVGSQQELESIDEKTVESAGEATEYMYIGNNFSCKFHRPKCPFAQAMRTTRRVYCRFRSDAVSLGYKPCRYCLPQRWTTVRAELLNPKEVLEHGGNKVESQNREEDSEFNSDEQKVQPSNASTD